MKCFTYLVALFYEQFYRFFVALNLLFIENTY